MKKKKFIYFGAVAVVVSSLLSCSNGSPLDLSNYTNITEEEAQEIIDSYDAETAFNQLDTLAYESKYNISYDGGETISDVTQERYDIDFQDESLYLYNSYSYESSLLGVSSSSFYLVNGSGDSYTEESLVDGESSSFELTLEEAKSKVDDFSSVVFSDVAWDDDLILELVNIEEAYFPDISYSSYENYLKVDVVVDIEETDDLGTTTVSGSAYAIYNGDGLLIYATFDVASAYVIFGGVFSVTTKITGYYSVEYNVDLEKLTDINNLTLL